MSSSAFESSVDEAAGGFDVTLLTICLYVTLLTICLYVTLSTICLYIFFYWQPAEMRETSSGLFQRKEKIKMEGINL